MIERQTSHPIESIFDGSKIAEAAEKEPPVRTVISWFGHSIRNMELLEDEDCRRWVCALKAMCKETGVVIERLGSMIDIIVGLPGRNVTPHEFFRFQRAFDALNERLECEMGGVLWLMDIHRQSGEDALVDAPREVYVNGRVSLGDSIGRPQRHYLPAIRNKKSRSVETLPASNAPKP